MKKIISFITEYLHWFVVGFVALLCVVFLIAGHTSEDGRYITLDGSDAQITETTKKWIEDANDALYRIMNEDAPTDEETIQEFENAEGLGGSVTLDIVKSRRKPDGFNDDGKGLQCSKYTAYLATGRMEYSSAHPDYGPVNGKDIAAWLVKNYGWKYTDKPVEGAIGSGGFNTLYGHTAEFLYWTGDNTAMVSDANYVPLTVATHNMNVSGWVWVVPGDYEPDPEPTPEPTPTPTPSPVSNTCEKIQVVSGDTLGAIMKRCKGYVEWGEAMNSYAQSWYSTLIKPNQSVYDGWHSYTGVGLYAGDIIEYRGN